jgi:hypothetical protein
MKEITERAPPRRGEDGTDARPGSNYALGVAMALAPERFLAR